MAVAANEYRIGLAAPGNSGQQGTAALNLSALNPFYSVTTISFTLLFPETVRLSILSVTGLKVITLVDGEYGAGDYRVRFDARDFPAGAYVCRLRTCRGTASALLFKQQ